MKLKIGTKIALGFSVILLLLVIMGLSSLLSSKSVGREVETIASVNEQLSIQKDIEIHFYNAVSGIRGYIAYGKEKFKDDYNREMGMVLELEKKLQDISSEEQKPEVLKLFEITAAYNKGITNDLMPAIEKQYAATDFKKVQEAQLEVGQIAGTLVPITGQLTESVRGLVSKNDKIFKDNIKATEEHVSKVITTSVTLTLVSIVIGIVLSLFLSRSIKKPILEMVRGADKFARGDFTEEIHVKSSDEVGDLAKSMNAMSGQLKALISDVIVNSQTLAAHSEELAASTQEVSATVEEVASTTSEVAVVAENSMKNASLTADESNKVVEVAESGGKTVRQTVDKINSISQSTAKVQSSVQGLGELSSKIGNITDLITGIADQTNLLALNAAIEAARAGDQGRGFAVVAEEVRKLAEQSASAAREIGQLINQIQTGVDVATRSMAQGTADVNEGVQLASEAGAALDNIIGAVNKNITLVNEIAESAGQTSEGMQQLSASNEQVTSTIQQVAGATQELADIASKLQASVSKFKV